LGLKGKRGTKNFFCKTKPAMLGGEGREKDKARLKRKPTRKKGEEGRGR